MTPFRPHTYQLPMVDHLVNKPRCALFAPMGVGKTPTTLMALDTMIKLGDAEKILVLAPLRVAATTWPREVSKWTDFNHLKVSAVVGTAAQREAALKVDADIYTTNYENIEWLIKHLGDDWFFDTVVADELTRLKSFRLRQGGRRAGALGKIAHTKVKRFIGLTGTPAPNGMQDLWGQIWFLDAGARLGRTFDSFSQRWFRTHPSGFGILALPHAQGEIQSRIDDVCLSVDPSAFFELGDEITNNVYVELPAEVRGPYRELERQLFTSIEGEDVFAANAAAKTMKCLQFANGAFYPDVDSKAFVTVHDEKLDALESIIAEAGGMPIIVAYHFVSDLARLQKRFKQGRHLDKKPETLKAFLDGRIPVLFLHPESAGHGLDGMQYVTNQIVFFGHWWAAESREQAIARIGAVRQAQAGLKRPVFIHNIVARNTVDELVLQRHQTKQSVQEILLAAMKGKQ